MERKILPTITTTNYEDGSSFNGWQGKISEIDQLNLKEVAVFLTGVKLETREELYKLLEQTKLEAVPFVHLKTDMAAWEMEYFINHWQTKVFNFHTQQEFKIDNDLSAFYKKIYLENTSLKLAESEIENFAGLCLDFSHFDDARNFNEDLYKQWLGIFKKYPIGCAHISAVKKERWFDKKYGDFFRHSSHKFSQLSEFDYLKNYPSEFFPEIIAIELENSLAEQLVVKEYIEGLLFL